jgi:hypothetical protein
MTIFSDGSGRREEPEGEGEGAWDNGGVTTTEGVAAMAKS